MNHLWKRFLSLALAMVMVISMVPVQAFATENVEETETVTVETEAATTSVAETSDVVPETTATPTDAAPETTEATVQASEPEDDAAVKSVQALIDALPVAVNSAEEAEALNAALAAVSDAIAELTTEQAEQVDMSRFDEATVALTDWMENPNGAEVYANTYTHKIPENVEKKVLTKQADAKLKESNLYTDVGGDYYWVKAAANETVNNNSWSQIKVGGLLSNPDEELDINVGDTIHVAKQERTGRYNNYTYTYTDVVIYTVVAPAAELTAKETATIPFNGYLKVGEQMAGGTGYADVSSEKYLEALILEKLVVKLGDTTVTAGDPNVTIQYLPWKVGTVSGNGEYGSQDKLRELNAAAPDAEELFGVGYTYKAFGERFQNGDTEAKEKIVISYKVDDETTLSVTREITLTEGRKALPTDAIQTSSKTVSEAAVKEAAAKAVTFVTVSAEDFTLEDKWEEKLVSGEPVGVAATATFAGNEEYVSGTISVTVNVTKVSDPAEIKVKVEGAGPGTHTIPENYYAGTVAFAVTPTDDGSYVESVTVQCGETTTTVELTYAETVASGSFDVENDKSYTVTITYGKATLDVKEDAEVALNLYVENYIDYSARLEGLKGKLLTALLGEDVKEDDYEVYVYTKALTFLGSDGYTAVDALQLYASQIEGTIQVKIVKKASSDGKIPAVSVEDISVKAVESRSVAYITIGEVAEITVTNGWKPVTDAVKKATTTNGGTVTAEITSGELPTPENPDGIVTVKVTVAESKDALANTEGKTVEVQVKLAKYTLTWDAVDGAFAEGEKTVTTEQYYGEAVVAPKNDPAREQTVSTTYTFAGWDGLKEGDTVTGEKTFTAKYNEEAREYTITWDAREGAFADKTTTKTTSVKYGETPVAPEEPEAEDKSFVGWEPKIEVVSGAATYTADYSDDTIYKVTFVYGNGTDDQLIRVNATKGEKLEKPEDPEWEGHVFTGWECSVEGTKFGEIPSCEKKEITFTAKWADDANGNGVDDTLETLTVKIEGTGEVKIGKTTLTAGEYGTAKYIFDSTDKEETLTITATPVVESKLSKTYVASMTNVGDVTYGENYVATAIFAPVKDMEITVTFADADFVLKEARVLNYYPGMTGVTSQNVYETAVSSPEWAPNAEITVEYLARKKGETVYINIDKLKFNDNSYVDSGIKTILKEFYKGSDGKIPVTQSETWVELGTDLSEFNFDSVPNYEEMFNKILEEKLESITLTNAIAVIQSIIQDIENTSQYYGAHEFGENASTSQDTEETIRLSYTDEKRNIQTTTTITLHDYRIPTQIVGSDMTLTYKDFKDSDLLDMVTVKTVNGATVDGATVALAEGIEEEKVSAYSVTFRYAGDTTYKPAEATFQVTIVKASASMDIDNVIVTYGSGYTMDHNIVPGNAYGDAKEIEDSLIKFVVGLDVANLSVGESGVTGTKTIVQIMLPEDLKSGLGELTGNWFENGVEMSLSDLVKALELINADSLEVLKQALEAIQKVTGDFTVRLGGNLPTDIGTYLYGAVSTSGNYETVLDVAYIIIKPEAQQVYLNWNYTDTNGIFTDALLKLDGVDLGASAYDENTFATKNESATASVRNLFFGVNKGEDNKPALVLKLYGAGIDPESFERDLGNGGFTQMAFIAEFGNEFYYAVPIVRAFAIVPNTATVSITDDEGTNFRRTYDGEKQELTITVNGEVPESGLEVTYVGVSTNGKAYKSATAPTDAGAYVVTALYRAYDDNDKLTGIGMAVKNLLVLPAETATTVDDAIVTVGDKVALKDIVHITAVGDPDVTILTAQLATDGSFSEIGVGAISGNINVDFPQWVDDILKKQAPEIYENGITVKELSDILNSKIKTALDGLNLGEELTQNLTEILDQLNESMNNLPVDANVTFNDAKETVFSQVGVYLVGAIVTDSNYRGSADYGLVVVKPNVQKVYLDWNYHDENGIWTEELLKYVDLYASAYDDPEFLYKNEKATETVTHTFLTVDSNGEVKVYHKAEELSYGAYLELAYIELEVDGTMTLSNLIARPVVTVPNTVLVEFVDENNTANADRIFDYDGNPHAMNVRVTKNGDPVDVQEGDLTVTYRGLTTAGEVYNSTTAPTDAGAYTVTAVYAKYENGKLIDGGVAVGVMAIKPAKVPFSVTGGVFPYDGDLHGVTVDPEDVDYTLIAATAKVSGAFTEIGFEAMEGVLNVDFPAWVDEILAEKYPEAYATGINAKTLLNKLKELNLEGTWVDTLVKLLEKVPSGVKVTFVDNIQFTQPGVYVFAGFLTDFNYVPASDTALLVIQKKDSGLKFEDTTVYYNGKSQSVNVTYTEETDYVTVIVDRERNIANILFEDDLTALKDLLEEKLGSPIPESIDVTTLMETINKVINDVSAWEYLPEDVKGALEQLNTLVGKLPQTGTIYINGGWRPVEVGAYEFYGISISPFYQTKTLSATLIIMPAKVTITVKDAQKTEGEDDPTNEPDIIVVQPEYSELDTSVLNIQVSRDAGESVGDYDYIVTYTENANFNVTVDAGKLTINAKADSGDEDNKNGKYPIYFHPEDQNDTIQPGATVEIDGKSYVLDEDCVAWVDNKDAKIAQTFIYNAGGDAHHTYPTHMYVWYLTFVGGNEAHYDATPVPELTDFFQYHGTSIRVNFTSNGIRFMTSVNRKDANALIGGSLIQTDVMKGYKMTQAGTLFKWGTTADTVLTNGNAASSLVYGVQSENGFRVFQKVGDRDWFTGMLTGLGTDKETLDKDLVSRPYAVLERDGETITIYGGTIQRSIYYVAKQNENWQVGTVYNDYIKNIIAAVEGQ